MSAGLYSLLVAAGAATAVLAHRLAPLLTRGAVRPSTTVERPAAAACGAVSYTLAGYVYGPGPQLLAVLTVLAVLLVVAVTDLRSRLIPNRLLGVGSALAAPLVLATGLRSFADAALGALVCGGLMLLVAAAARGGLGGGDVKLAAFIGLVLGWRHGLLGLTLGVLLGGVAGAALLLSRRRRPGDTIAYGPFLCAGAAAALLWGGPLLAWYLGG